MYDPRVFSFKFERHCVAWSYFVFFASIGISLRHFCKHSELFDFFTNSLFFLRRFCGDFRFSCHFCGDFAAILGSKVVLRTKNGNQISAYEKSGIPFVYWDFPILSTLGCPDGLEPSTFRTTSRFPNSPGLPLSIGVYVNHKNRVCADFAPISTLQ